KGTTNDELAALIVRLEKSAKANKAPLWAQVAKLLSKPCRSLAEVNVSRLGRSAPKESKALLVPGVVLGGGKTYANKSVAAWRFTRSARASIEKAGGKPMTISELLEQNPKGKDIAIIV
ncbi:50S ribosomal protein L18e, partial [Candidatus Micrarchaeota archaeon]